MTVQARGRMHRPDVVTTVPRVGLEPDPERHVQIDAKLSGRVNESAVDASKPTQTDVLLEFQKAFPPKSRVDVQWDDPVTIYGGVIVGKGRLDTTGTAMFQVLYDEGKQKFWHEIDGTRVTKRVLERVAIIGLMRGEVLHVRGEDGGDDLERDLASDVREAWKLFGIHVGADETEARRELELLRSGHWPLLS